MPIDDSIYAGTLKIDVDCSTEAVDGAIEKFETLGDATADLAPMVSIRECRGCTINVYASRNTWTDAESEDE